MTGGRSKRQRGQTAAGEYLAAATVESVGWSMKPISARKQELAVTLRQLRLASDCSLLLRFWELPHACRSQLLDINARTPASLSNALQAKFSWDAAKWYPFFELQLGSCLTSNAMALQPGGPSVCGPQCRAHDQDEEIRRQGQGLRPGERRTCRQCQSLAWLGLHTAGEKVCKQQAEIESRCRFALLDCRLLRSIRDGRRRVDTCSTRLKEDPCS